MTGLRQVATVTLISAAVAGCGSGGGSTSTSRAEEATAARTAQPADFDAIRRAVAELRREPQGRYVFVQSIGSTSGDEQVAVTRRGQYDAATRLHQVDIAVPASDGREGVELTFLTAADDILMKNPAFTARHGKPWTRLPAEAVGAVGGDPTAAETEPPGLDVLDTAGGPGRVTETSAGLTEYEVAVQMYDAIELFSNSGYLKLSKETGLSPEQLPDKFAGTVTATVVTAEDGALRSFKLDLTPILKRAAELGADRLQGGADAEIGAEVTLDPGAAVDLSLPPDQEIGSLE